MVTLFNYNAYLLTSENLLDHVAMIYKDRFGQVILFESTGKEGVGLCRWSTFMFNDWQNLYQRYLLYEILQIMNFEMKRMVFRKLEMVRSYDTTRTVEEFIKVFN